MLQYGKAQRTSFFFLNPSFKWFAVGLGLGVSMMLPYRTNDLLRIPDPNVAVTQSKVGKETIPGQIDKRSLINGMAAAFFTIDPQTGHILFPDSVKQVVIDVGARDSDYLNRLLEVDDKSVGLILFDPMPHSYIPVSNKLSGYQMRNASKFWLDTEYMNSIFSVRAALGEEEGIVDFNIAIMPSCGSILEFKAGDKKNHWCQQSSQKIKAVVLRLESIINMIPPRIRDIHLKTDVEGFDLHVLKGAGQAVRRLRTVIIECSVFNTREEIPSGFFNCSDALEYMDSFHTFTEIIPSSEGHGKNLFWIQKGWNHPSGSLPDFFKDKLDFQMFYKQVESLL